MDDILGKLRQVAAQRRLPERAASERSYGEASKTRLRKILEKKVKTAFLGPLETFEAKFGHLWGHGLDECDLDENQLAWRSQYEQVRSNFFRIGNDQLRAINAELDEYDVKWNRHRLTMPVSSNLRTEEFTSGGK